MLHNLFYLMITAFAVSVDSLLAGFSLSLNKKKSAFLPLIVAGVTLALCTAAMFAGKALSSILSGDTIDFIGAAVLFTIGLLNILKKEEKNGLTVSDVSFSQSVAVGFAVGFDAAAANLSLTFLGFTNFDIPLLFTLMHFYTVYAGQSLAQTKSDYKPRKTNIISGAVLIALAAIKLLP